MLMRMSLNNLIGVIPYMKMSRRRCLEILQLQGDWALQSEHVSTQIMAVTTSQEDQGQDSSFSQTMHLFIGYLRSRQVQRQAHLLPNLLP